MKRLNQSGMSLIEVMVAISILAVISVGVMTMMKNMSKSSRTATKAFDMESAMREIQQLMANKEHCSATLFNAGGTVGATTPIFGLRELDSQGRIMAHPRLISSTPGNPAYVANGMIIRGMAFRIASESGSGASGEFYVTFMKSVKAGSSATAADATYGQNMITRKFTVQVDNCARYVAAGPTALQASSQCTDMGGVPIGPVVPVFSDVSVALNAYGVPDYTQFQACQRCDPGTGGGRTTVRGCL